MNERVCARIHTFAVTNESRLHHYEIQVDNSCIETIDESVILLTSGREVFDVRLLAIPGGRPRPSLIRVTPGPGENGSFFTISIYVTSRRLTAIIQRLAISVSGAAAATAGILPSTILGYKDRIDSSRQSSAWAQRQAGLIAPTRYFASSQPRHPGEVLDPSWLNLIAGRLLCVDCFEGLAEFVGERVGDGDGVPPGLDLDGPVAAGGLDEFPDGPAGPVLDPAADRESGEDDRQAGFDRVAQAVADGPACRSLLAILKERSRSGRAGGRRRG